MRSDLESIGKEAELIEVRDMDRVLVLFDTDE